MKKVYSQADNTKLQELVTTLNKYKEVFMLNTCARKSHFFAQSREESGLDLRGALEGESLNYAAVDLPKQFSAFRANKALGKKSPPNEEAYLYGRSEKNGWKANQKKIAEIAYSTREDLGNQGGEDGWTFKGKGLLQITGRYNYGEIQKEINKLAVDSRVNVFDSVPESGYTPHQAAITGMADWTYKKLYDRADKTGEKTDDEVVDFIVDKLNKGTPSRPQRKVWYRGGEVKDDKGKIILSVIESSSTKFIFKVPECGKVDEPLIFTNTDLKIQQGIDWLLTKSIDQSEVGTKSYKVTYSNDQNRTSASGENTMDCSELVCRYLQKIEWSEKVMAGNTRLLYEFSEQHSQYLQKHDSIDYKPQIGDIFIWKNKSGGMGHTGVIINYEEKTVKKQKNGKEEEETLEIVTTIEAISSTETPYGSGKIAMKGVIKLQWLRKSRHLLEHALSRVKNNKTQYFTPCRFYTPLVHYTKADKKIIWKKDGSASFEIKKKQ